MSDKTGPSAAAKEWVDERLHLFRDMDAYALGQADAMACHAFDAGAAAEREAILREIESSPYLQYLDTLREDLKRFILARQPGAERTEGGDNGLGNV